MLVNVVIVFFFVNFVFFFNDTATTEIYTLSLHDALPISHGAPRAGRVPRRDGGARSLRGDGPHPCALRSDRPALRTQLRARPRAHSRPGSAGPARTALRPRGGLRAARPSWNRGP